VAHAMDMVIDLTGVGPLLLMVRAPMWTVSRGELVYIPPCCGWGYQVAGPAGGVTELASCCICMRRAWAKPGVRSELHSSVAGREAGVAAWLRVSPAPVALAPDRAYCPINPGRKQPTVLRLLLMS
jgi:hypothetical protein